MRWNFIMRRFLVILGVGLLAGSWGCQGMNQGALSKNGIPLSDPAAVYVREHALPALVHLQSIGRTNMRTMFGILPGVKSTAVGSGYIIQEEGKFYIVTNYHVAGGAERVLITLSNGFATTGHTLGGDPYLDVAVVTFQDPSVVDRFGIQPVEFGSSADLQAGERVFALGNPEAFFKVMTEGIIANPKTSLLELWKSASEQPLGDAGLDFIPVIEHDAAINPGNSGGPLINAHAEVIGMNTWGLPGANTMGFASPSNLIHNAVRQIIKKGYVEWGWIGTDLGALTNDERTTYGVGPDMKGVVVSNVNSDSPAAKAGIQAGDIITHVDGREVSASFFSELPDVNRFIAQLPLGKTVDIQLIRNGKPLTKQVVVDDALNGVWVPLVFQAWQDNPRYYYKDKTTGIKVMRIPKELAHNLGITSTNGVLVVDMDDGSPFQVAGLNPEDIILQVNGQAIQTLEDFKRVWNEVLQQKKKKVVLTVAPAAQRWQTQSVLVVNLKGS